MISAPFAISTRQWRKRFSAKHGVQQSFTNVAATLDEAQPDLALILVPTDGQSAVAVEAAKRGINIITEIPYGITLEVGDAIRDVCREHGVVWEIAEQVWLWPQEQLKAKNRRIRLHRPGLHVASLVRERRVPRL